MARPLTVLVHGQPGSHLDWRPVLDRLPDVPLLAPDRPGYNGEPAAGFAQNAAALLRALDAAEAPTAYLAGHSWGAGVALATALAAPDRVAGLVLVTPVGSPLAITRGDRLVGGRVTGATFALAMRLIARHTIGLGARAVGSRLDAPTKRYIRAELAQRDLPSAWRAWRVEQRALIEETPGLAGRLAEITAPTIILAGRRDTAVSPAAARDLARRMSGTDVDFRELDTGHLMPLEAPDAVAAAIRDIAGHS